VYKTYAMEADFVAPNEGRYYVTVIAYNHALDASAPVCSDSVVIDTSVPDVSEIVVGQAKVSRMLLKDKLSTFVYLLDNNREIVTVDNPTAECW